jgi:hypothetical protein
LRRSQGRAPLPVRRLPPPPPPSTWVSVGMSCRRMRGRRRGWEVGRFRLCDVIELLPLGINFPSTCVLQSLSDRISAPRLRCSSRLQTSALSCLATDTRMVATPTGMGAPRIGR